MMIFVVIALMVCVLIIGLYNSLVRKRNSVDNAWAHIRVQLERRHELIPNLVQAVKGYAAHERRTFEAVADARAMAIAAHGPAAQARAEDALTKALRSVFAVAEAYPRLQASRNFSELQSELSDTENRIAYARQYYNDAVLSFNGAVQTLPSNIVAGALGFEAREFFSAPETDRVVVAVDFS
ncbi:LemA family protein [Skermania sp. ID1734]|nr:LemA family protein [Skermania sp. ID1734]